MITGQIEPNALFTFTVDQYNSIQRIDQYLATQFPQYSRSFFQRLIQKKYVSHNGAVTVKPSSSLAAQDTITIQFPPARVVEPEVLNTHTTGVSIIAITEHFIVVYKPVNLMVHAPSQNSPAVTLTDWIVHNYKEIAHVGLVDRPGIVHRLDKDTSGIMIITRTNHAHTVFNNLFKQRNISKTYYAIVEGHPAPQGTISLSIGRNPRDRTKMAAFNEMVSPEEQSKINNIKVRHALTDYKVLRYFENAALIEVKPTTGRTHQIRVHMAAIGHPIIGDKMYGNSSPLINRQALHAYSLSFTFDNIPYTFNYDVPTDFQHLINNLQPVDVTIEKK
jgi:23S rRNA pseudouridine1911/1915/1917 synthase